MESKNRELFPIEEEPVKIKIHTRTVYLHPFTISQCGYIAGSWKFRSKDEQLFSFEGFDSTYESIIIEWLSLFYEKDTHSNGYLSMIANSIMKNEEKRDFSKEVSDLLSDITKRIYLLSLLQFNKEIDDTIMHDITSICFGIFRHIRHILLEGTKCRILISSNFGKYKDSFDVEIYEKLLKPYMDIFREYFLDSHDYQRDRVSKLFNCLLQGFKLDESKLSFNRHNMIVPNPSIYSVLEFCGIDTKNIRIEYPSYIEKEGQYYFKHLSVLKINDKTVWQQDNSDEYGDITLESKVSIDLSEYIFDEVYLR